MYIFFYSAAWTEVKNIHDEDPSKQAAARQAKMEELGLVAQIAITPYLHANPGKKMYENVHLHTFTYICVHFADHPDNAHLREMHVAMGHPPQWEKASGITADGEPTAESDDDEEQKQAKTAAEKKAKDKKKAKEAKKKAKEAKEAKAAAVREAKEAVEKKKAEKKAKEAAEKKKAEKKAKEAATKEKGKGRAAEPKADAQNENGKGGASADAGKRRSKRARTAPVVADEPKSKGK